MCEASTKVDAEHEKVASVKQQKQFSFLQAD